MYAGQPSGSYFVGIDSTARKLWFERPAKYVVTWNVAFTVGPTGTPSHPLLYTETISSGTGTVTASAAQANFTGFDKKVWTATWYVTTQVPDTSVEFTVQSALGGISFGGLATGFSPSVTPDLPSS